MNYDRQLLKWLGDKPFFLMKRSLENGKFIWSNPSSSRNLPLLDVPVKREKKNIFSNARKGEITKAEADEFFDCADEVLSIIS